MRKILSTLLMAAFFIVPLVSQAQNDGTTPLTIIVDDTYSFGREICIFDINGRMLHHNAKANATETYRVPASGVYLVKVAGIETKRVVVVR